MAIDLKTYANKCIVKLLKTKITWASRFVLNYAPTAILWKVTYTFLRNMF